MAEPIVKQLVEMSGLSPIFAETTIRRAFERAGVDPGCIQPDDVEQLLAELDRSLRAYLGGGVEAHLRKIREVLP